MSDEIRVDPGYSANDILGLIDTIMTRSQEMAGLVTSCDGARTVVLREVARVARETIERQAARIAELEAQLAAAKQIDIYPQYAQHPMRGREGD